MGIALLSSYRSKDPSTQVGACIVDDNNKIMSVGYNGFPHGCDDDEFPWDRTGDEFDKKFLHQTSPLGSNLNPLDQSLFLLFSTVSTN